MDSKSKIKLWSAVLVENVQKGAESAKNFYSSRAPQHNLTPKLKIVYQ